MLSAVAASYDGEDVAATIGPLYPQLIARMQAANVMMAGPGLAYYDPAPGSTDAVTCHAAFPIGDLPPGEYDFTIVDLPSIEQAATVIHHGAMESADTSMQVLATWVEENGLSVR